MLSGNATRNQIVLPAQRKLYDYWRSKCRKGAFPSRQDILPEDIKSHLPTISLIKPETEDPTGACRYRYRLAGTGFWPFYQEEITGRYVDELPIGDRGQYWNRVLDQVRLTKRASVGVTRPGTPYGSHFVQFWIRLPLATNGSDINMILGFDQMVTLSDVESAGVEREQIYA